MIPTSVAVCRKLVKGVAMPAQGFLNPKFQILRVTLNLIEFLRILLNYTSEKPSASVMIL